MNHNGQVTTHDYNGRFLVLATLPNSSTILIELPAMNNCVQLAVNHIVKWNESPTYPPGPLDGSTPCE